MVCEKKLAIYMRLSKEADGETEESLSITNQRSVILDFIQNTSELSQLPIEEFIDDGYSGTNIKRPALTRLLQDIQKEEINCIIVKDLSRFMRNHILQGQFLELLFPMISVRFISVTDSYDNKEKTSDNDIVLPIKGLTHELYARDLSKKIKSIKQNQIKNGVLKVGAAPYGYVLDSSEKTYKIDQEAANIVKQIYALALEGKKCIEIARILNQEKVLSPGVYKRIKGMNQASKKDVLWNSDTIRRILRNA